MGAAVGAAVGARARAVVGASAAVGARTALAILVALASLAALAPLTQLPKMRLQNPLHIRPSKPRRLNQTRQRRIRRFWGSITIQEITKDVGGHF